MLCDHLLRTENLLNVVVRMIEPQAEQDGAKKKDLRSRPRPLYDIPYMFEAREFLRKKLIGKKVRIETDRYIG